MSIQWMFKENVLTTGWAEFTGSHLVKERLTNEKRKEEIRDNKIVDDIEKIKERELQDDYSTG